MRVKRAWILFLAAYLAVWAGFGLAYWGIARRVPGSFAFQQEIQLQCKVRRLLAGTASSGALAEKTKKLFLEYDRGLAPLLEWYGGTARSVPNFTSQGYGPIGEDWADYYCEKYRILGVSSFDYTVSGGMNAGYIHLGVTLYRPGRIPAETIGLELPKALFSGWEAVSEVQNPAESGRPVTELRNLLALSAVFPGDDILRLYRIDGGECVPGFLEFLYFSAVTVATLGYGDISPNCPLVRGMVVAETFSGMVVFALFTASFYDFLKRMRKAGASA